MMRHLAGLRWQSQRRRRRPSGQRRPSTKPSRGRAWVTHTAPKQPSLPSAEDERAAWGPPPAAAARTMPMLRNAFEPFVTQMLSYTSRMSLQWPSRARTIWYSCIRIDRTGALSTFVHPPTIGTSRYRLHSTVRSKLRSNARSDAARVHSAVHARHWQIKRHERDLTM